MLTCHTRPATAADEPLLWSLFVADRLPVLLDMQYAGRAMTWSVRWPDAEDLVICAGEEAVGRLLLDRSTDAWRIIDLAVLPAQRGRGLASGVLTHVLREATDAGATVGLRVERDNPARHLYARLGFRVTGGDELSLTMSTSATSEEQP